MDLRVSKFDELRKFKNLTFDELCQLEDNTVVAIVNDIQFTVYELKKLRPKQHITVDIITAAMSFDQAKSNLKSVVLPLLNQKLRNVSCLDRVIEKKEDYYKEKVNNMDIVVIPINSGKHWTVEIFYPKQNVIEHYNPLDCLTPYSILDAHKEFFERILNKSIQLISANNYPKQNNSTDCGLFVIKYVEFILLEKPLTKWIDFQIPDFREELVKIFRTLPHKPDFDNHRDARNEEICEDDLIIEDDIDETSDIEPKVIPSQSSIETIRLPNLMNRTTFNSDHSAGNLDYWPSLNNIYKTDEPFIGKNSKGFEKTYNIKGNFKNMLSIMEILMYFAPGNPKKGLELLEIEIKNDKEMAVIWAKKGRKENEELTPYHFRWAGYFNKVQKWMWTHHKIKLKDNFKSKKCQKKEKYYAKLSSGMQ